MNQLVFTTTLTVILVDVFNRIWPMTYASTFRSYHTHIYILATLVLVAALD